jgi:PAS domain-containing protein
MAMVRSLIAPRSPQLPHHITAPPAAAHPKIVRLYDYWRHVAPPGGGLPGRTDIDPTDVPMLLDHIWLLDVVGEPRRFRFRLLGGAAERRKPPVRTGDFIDQFFEDGVTDERLDDLHFVVTARQPVWFRGPPRLKHKSEIAELERLHLPLAADGVDVNMILCLTVYYSLAGGEI